MARASHGFRWCSTRLTPALRCPPISARASAASTRAQADFVVGDRDGTTCDAGFTEFVRSVLAGMGHDVRVNDPYRGVELVRAYSNPGEGRMSLQLEINKRLYMDEATRTK